MAWEIRTDRIAEGDVAKLCQLRQGRVTPVKEDENGWDLLVEFPPAVESAFSDVDPPIRRCVIQVKSVRSRRASTKVKLSNALALAKDPLPCFTILLTYPDSSAQFEAAYLQHVWGTPMMEALLKSRQAKVAKRPLNRQSVPISFKPGERHDHDVIGALLAAIDAVGPDYGEKKRKLREAMGHENGWGKLNFAVEGEDPLRDLDDLMLGLRPDLPLASTRLVRTRFDIPGPEEALGPARLSLAEAPNEKCVLGLRRGHEELVWSGEVFKGLDIRPQESRRVRLVGGPLSVIMAGDRSVKANWSAPLDRPRPFDELLREVRFRSWMDGTELFLSVWTERGEFQPIGMTFDKVNNDESWPDFLKAVTALAGIVPAERRPHDLQVSLTQIAEGLEAHLVFAQLCGPAQHGMRIVLNEGVHAQFDKVTHILAPWATRLGDYYLVAVVERAVTAVERGDRQVDFETRDGRILRGSTIKVTEATEALLAKEVRWAREQAKASDRRILSFLPERDGSGNFEVSWDDGGVARESGANDL